MRYLIKKYRWNFIFLLMLVLIDAGLMILYPLFIGLAIDGALAGEYQGAILLGSLGMASLFVGAGRRFYDSRFYAKVYQALGVEVGGRSEESPSSKTAHLGFLGEVVEFFENSMPDIINNSIGLIGTLIIIAAMDFRLFTGCLTILVIVFLVYGFTRKKTLWFNDAYNSEMEKQVAVLSENNAIGLRWHLKKLMKWNIKLSDVETINFSIVWLFMMAFLVAAIVLVQSGNDSLTHGYLFALILYLFQFIEGIAVMPLYYQQWLRLTGIAERLSTSVLND